VSEGWPWSGQFTPESTYVNTASLGLPPRPTVDALDAVHREWRLGRVQATDFDPVVADARAAYARLVGVDPATVAVGHQVSPLVGLVASSLPPGSTVLTAEGDFTSVTFPFLARREHGVRVVEAPLGSLADHVDGTTSLVAVSLVQSADGALTDLEAVRSAAARHGAEVLLDLTQAAGWLPVDAGRVGYTVCGGYKWLMSPRGTAFLTVRPDLLADLVPAAAGWYAGAEPWTSIYGSPLRLAEDARRLDTSPAWFGWVGTRASLAFLEEVGVDAVHAHDVEVEAAFADAAGLAPTGRALRALDVDGAVPGILDRAGVVAATRAGRLRVSFHVHNTVPEAERLGRLVRGHVIG
jgi:selenocysteine lyase/cysteine desulfurase